MPSLAELQSIATMEAMASGLPVVAANAMALPHLVHDGENGYLFEPGDVDDFAGDLTDVLDGAAARARRDEEGVAATVAAHDIQRTLDISRRCIVARRWPTRSPTSDSTAAWLTSPAAAGLGHGAVAQLVRASDS